MNAPFSTMGKPEPQIVVFTSAMRTLIADAIESLILLLDEIDGDVEHEEDADFENEPDMEPSLASLGRTGRPGKTTVIAIMPLIGQHLRRHATIQSPGSECDGGRERRANR